MTAQNLDQLPPSDVARADDFFYDTDIDSDIPDNKDIAREQNILKITRTSAEEQINKMEKLVNDVGFQVVKNQIPGETITTNSPAGVKMIMARLSWAKTIGRDLDGDTWPDIPLRFEIEDSPAVIQFPLGWCPGSRTEPEFPEQNFRCVGDWGIVIKEWQIVVKVRLLAHCKTCN